MADEKNEDNKIASNPSAAKLVSALPLVKLLAASPESLMRLLGMSKEAAQAFRNTARELKKQSDILTLPDEFNAQFAKDGWIATSSFSPDIMRSALKEMREGNADAAETEILSWFTEERIRLFAITRGKRFNETQHRYHQMVEALTLYSEERYVSAVPLILIICDGLASDVLGTSPFEKDADLLRKMQTFLVLTRLQAI